MTVINCLYILATGHIQIINKCISCACTKRSIEYCRVQQRHQGDNVQVCSECLTKGNTVSKCRRELQHKQPNGINTRNVFNIQDEVSCVKTKCLAHEIPECSEQLSGLTVEQPVQEEESREDYMYATGYLDHYTPTAWDTWLNTFQLQTSTRYSIRQGKQTTVKNGNHGLIHYHEKVLGYQVQYSQTYHCYRGGKGRLKPENRDPLKRRSAPGSKCMGCPAKIHLRLLLLENGSEIAEVKIPRLSVHQQHDPSSAADLQGLCPLPEIEKKVKSLIQQAYLRQVALMLTMKDWVESELIPQHLSKGIIDHIPSHLNRAYYPNRRDIRNMTRKAITEQRGSKFDQEALETYLDEKAKSGLKYLLKKFTCTNDTYVIIPV